LENPFGNQLIGRMASSGMLRQEPQDVTSQKTPFFIVIAVKNLKSYIVNWKTAEEVRGYSESEPLWRSDALRSPCSKIT
jgi:hypothetical protein